MGVKKVPQMTCIIGGKCTDGVALVADRKIIYGNGNVRSKEKIFKDYHPYVIAASGETISFDNFRKEALELAQNSRGMFNERAEFRPLQFDSSVFSGVAQLYSSSTTYPVIHHPRYLEGLKQIARKKKDDVKQNKDRYRFDVLVASQTNEGLARLSYIDDNGALNDIFDPYIIIGSDSAAMYGSVFIKSLYKQNIKTNDFAKLAYFTIKYIDRFKLDDTIGLEDGRPVVFIIPNKGDVGRASDSLMDGWESDTNKMLDNFEMHGIDKLL